MKATGATISHCQAPIATTCFRNLRRMLGVKLTFICLVLVSLFGVAFKYNNIATIQTYRRLNIQGYETEHGLVSVFRSLKTDESAKRMSVLFNVTRNANKLTYPSVSEQPQFNNNIYVADSIANSLKSVVVKATEPKFHRRIDVTDLKVEDFKTAMVKTTNSHPNEKLTDDITKVNQTDRSVLYTDRRVTLTMSEISRIGSKLPGNLTSLQPLGPGVKESPEFPEMPDPCTVQNRFTGVEDILCIKPPTFLPDYKNPCWHEDTVFRCFPYFHLIGVCKSGTSDLFNRLLTHPDIIPNGGIGGKEIWYWSWRRLDIMEVNGTINPGMTLKDFTNLFPSSGLQATDTTGKHNKITGHGDPMDFWDRFLDRNTPQNTPGAEELLWTTPYAIRHVNPDVKLLLMLRDPVDRLYSHYFHGGYGTSAQSFHEHVVIAIEKWNACTSSHSIRHCMYDQPFGKTLPVPIYTSFYIVHLFEWLKVFPREQILIFRNEDYTAHMNSTLREIFRFLDVDVPNDSILAKMTDMAPFYVSEKRKSAGNILPETKRLLVELYRPYTQQLAAFLGDERFAWQDASFAAI